MKKEVEQIKQFNLIGLEEDGVEGVGTVYKTYRRDLFKKLSGNRGIEPARIESIKDSVIKNGNIPCPIIVNEKMEIIDGQGRFAAIAEDLKQPIYFIIVKDLGIDECAAMNTSGKQWEIPDFIKMYADPTNYNLKSYQLFFNLILNYSSEYDNDETIYPDKREAGRQFDANTSTIYCAAFGSTNMHNDAIKQGKFNMTEEQYHEARKVLDYITSIMTHIETKYMTSRGGNGRFMQAIAICCKLPGVDWNRLSDCILGKITIDRFKWSNVYDCIIKFDEWYNHGLRKNRVDIKDLYEHTSNYKRSRSTSAAQYNMKAHRM